MISQSIYAGAVLVYFDWRRVNDYYDRWVEVMIR
jgi:hypothetical protein